MVLIKRGDLDIRMHTEARGHNKKVAIPKPMGRTSGKTKPTDTFNLDYWPQHKKYKICCLSQTIPGSLSKLIHMVKLIYGK